MDSTPRTSVPAASCCRPEGCGCVALVLQGGGALGAYQAGVYDAMEEAGLHPDWVAGVSIGAINTALIAGNPPGRRVERLRAFWERVTARGVWPVPTEDGDRAGARDGLGRAATGLRTGAGRHRLVLGRRPRLQHPAAVPAGTGGARWAGAAGGPVPGPRPTATRHGGGPEPGEGHSLLITHPPEH